MGQQEMGQACEVVSSKWFRIVRGSTGIGKGCEGVSRKWGRSVRVSASGGPKV